MDGYLGQIMMFGPTWAPRNWALCEGGLLQITNNQALFSLIGTLYGGDGRTSFALPDLRGRVAIGSGTGLGLTPRTNGQSGGSETVILSTLEMPSHTHGASSSSTTTVGLGGTASSTTLAGSLLASTAAAPIANGTASSNTLGGVNTNTTTTTQATGGNQSHLNMQPFEVVSFIICISGIYPSRS